MAEPPKFTPKKRPTACMQSSDDGGGSNVEDLCRKKFKPIAPKPFLKKDGHQSMLTTALPVKSLPPETKDGATSEAVAPNSTSNKHGSHPSSSSVPVMYGGPVFIPVRFPFPVLVPAMLNINQKCTCCPSKDPPDETKPAEGGDPSLSRGGSSNQQQPCPVHYAYNSSQPTYINQPIPNMHSSLMPMYIDSGSNTPSDRDCSDKPKPSRYKYSMLRNGDIYKGRTSAIPGYGDWGPTLPGQYPSPYQPYPSQTSQYPANIASKEYQQGTAGGSVRGFDTSVPYSAVPSRCDTMCQTSSSQGTSTQPGTRAGAQPTTAPATSKAVGVDAAVQTDSPEPGTSSNNNSVTSDSRATNSSSAQCSFPPGGFPASSQSLSTNTTGNRMHSGHNLSNNSQSNRSALPPSALSSQPLSSFTAGYNPLMGSKDNLVLPPPPPVVPAGVGGVPRSPVNSRAVQPLSSSESPSCEDTPPRRLHSSAFSSRSGVLSSSEALQQRNYETDVIVPLRAAPSPSDAHNGEDMDRFVLSPVISESDSEDNCSRTMPPAATFYRSQQERSATDAATLGTTHPGVPPSDAHRRNLWASTSSVHGRDRPTGMAVNPPMTGSSLGFPHQRLLPSSYPPRDYINPHPVYHSITPYPPALSRTSSMYPNPHQFSKELHTGLYRPPEKGAPHQPLGPDASRSTGLTGSNGRFSDMQQGSETSRQTRDEQATESSDRARDEPGGTARFGSGTSAIPSRQERSAHVQSVPLQSNLASGEGQSNLAKDGRDPFSSSGSSFSVPATRHNSGTSKDSALDHRRPGPASSAAEAPSRSLYRNAIPSSSAGYHLPYTAPPLMCRNTVPSIHDPVAHSLHGLPSRPGLGVPTIPSAHSLQPGSVYHGQHMYYPHYGSHYQSMSMPPSPTASDLLSPRSCSHLHFPGSMLHSPQSSMHSFQRPLGGGYHYPMMDDRLDACCTSRVIHSPPREDRSIPTLLTNILHRRPGAFSHLEQSAAADRTRGPVTLPSQVAAANALRSAVSTVTSSSQSRPSQVASNAHDPSVPTVSSSHQPRLSQVTSGISQSSVPTFTSSIPSRALLGAPSAAPSISSLALTRPSPAAMIGRHPSMPSVVPTCHPRMPQVIPIGPRSSVPIVTSSMSSRPSAMPHSTMPSVCTASVNPRISQAAVLQSSVPPHTPSLQARPSHHVMNAGHLSTPAPMSNLQTPQHSMERTLLSNSQPAPNVSSVAGNASSVSTGESNPRQVDPTALPSSTISSTVSGNTLETASQARIRPTLSTGSTALITRTVAGSTTAPSNQPTITPSPISVTSPISSPSRPINTSDKYLPSPMSSPPATPARTASRAGGAINDKYLPVEVTVPPSPTPSSASIPAVPDSVRQTGATDQVVKYGEHILECSRQILRVSGRTVLCCWSCDYHTAEPRKMHRHQKRENQLQKCQLCDFRADTRCKVNQHYKEEHMDKDDPFRSVSVQGVKV